MPVHIMLKKKEEKLNRYCNRVSSWSGSYDHGIEVRMRHFVRKTDYFSLNTKYGMQ